jgi:CheY-like chemotaxis protein
VSRVLVIDDDAAIRRLLRAVLEAEGYEVEEAASGVEGLRRYASSRADVVLCDVEMPGASGTATAAGLRGFDPQVRLIFLSGRTTDRDDPASAARRAWAVATLEKPITPEALVEAVRRAVGEG